MAIGRMRTRVEIQQLTEEPDETHDPIATWTTVATRFAQLDPVSGREKVEGGQTQGETTIQVTLRYYPGLTSRYRLKIGSRILNIVAVVNEGDRNVWHKLLATETPASDLPD